MKFDPIVYCLECGNQHPASWWLDGRCPQKVEAVKSEEEL